MIDCPLVQRFEPPVPCDPVVTSRSQPTTAVPSTSANPMELPIIPWGDAGYGWELVMVGHWNTPPTRALSCLPYVWILFRFSVCQGLIQWWSSGDPGIPWNSRISSSASVHRCSLQGWQVQHLGRWHQRHCSDLCSQFSSRRWGPWKPRWVWWVWWVWWVLNPCISGQSESIFWCYLVGS